MLNARKWFAIAAVLLLLLVFIVALDNYNQEWKQYQRAYLTKIFTDTARAEKGSLSLLDQLMIAVNAETNLQIKKVVTEVGRSADLCMSCHVNTGVSGFEREPLRDLLETHKNVAIVQELPFDQIGCTACHGGNALALRAEPAHQEMRTRFAQIFEESIEKLRAEKWAERQRGIERIRWMTANDFGFVFNAAKEKREEAIRRLLAWWQLHKDTFLVEGFGERSSPFRTENPQAKIIDQRTDVAVTGEPLPFVGSATCVACHGHPEISEVYIPESSKQHVERWFREEFMTSTNPEEYQDHPFIDQETLKTMDVTCEACHGPGSEYTKLMQKGMALEAAGQSVDAAALIGKAKEIARANARQNISEHDPATGYSRIWAIFERLIEKALAAKGQIRPTE
jgi:cytochrome c553